MLVEPICREFTVSLFIADIRQLRAELIAALHCTRHQLLCCGLSLFCSVCCVVVCLCDISTVHSALGCVIFSCCTYSFVLCSSGSR